MALRNLYGDNSQRNFVDRIVRHISGKNTGAVPDKAAGGRIAGTAIFFRSLCENEAVCDRENLIGSNDSLSTKAARSDERANPFLRCIERRVLKNANLLAAAYDRQIAKRADSDQ